MQVAVALDPDVAVGVDQHLVDLVIGQQRVERAETVEPGDGGAHEPFARRFARQRGDPAQVRPHDVSGVAVVALRGSAELGDEPLVERRGRRSRRPSQFPGERAREASGQQAGVDHPRDRRVEADGRDDRRTARVLDVALAQLPTRLGHEHDAVGPATGGTRPPQREVAVARDEQAAHAVALERGRRRAACRRR